MSAFASHSTSSLPSIHGRTGHHSQQLRSNNRQHLQRKHGNNNDLRVATNLHLSIPRGGAVAAASKLTEMTSTPTGLFNVALVLLGLTTAGLKLFNAGDSAGGGDGGGEVVVS